MNSREEEEEEEEDESRLRERVREPDVREDVRPFAFLSMPLAPMIH